MYNEYEVMSKLPFAFLVISLLAGCQDKKLDATAIQVVAKVNGDEITVHQLSSEMQRLQVPVSNSQSVAKKLLINLIDRQLLMQEAIKLNLDRSPEVVQLLNTARAQIYAQAYLTRKVSAMPPVTEQEASQFMAEHTEVFKRRKIFTTEDIIFANNLHKVNYEQLQTLVNNASELKAWLSDHQVPFEFAEENIPTEALPKEALSVVDQIRIGDLLFMHDDTKIIVRSIVNISEAPLKIQQAKAIATKIVNDRRRQQLMLNEIQRLKKLAKIEVLETSLKADVGTVSTRGELSTRGQDKSSTTLHNGLKGL